MSIRVAIVSGPLPVAEDGPVSGGAGALLKFEGVVRAEEDGVPIAGLHYQHYEGMAEAELRRLAEEVAAHHGLLAVRVWHSRGEVPAGRCSFRLEVESAHRAEALRAVSEFIDRMKRDVPIWKRVIPRELARPG